MKKSLLGVSMLSAALLLGACGETTSEPVKSTSSSNEKKVEKEEVVEEVKTPEVEEVLIDSETVKIVYRGASIDESFMGKEGKITFDIENKTDSTIVVQERELSIDGVMVDETILSFSSTIAANKKANKQSVTISEFDGYDFPELTGVAEMNLIIINDETFETIEEHPITITFE